jgi:hypothetical protein
MGYVSRVKSKPILIARNYVIVITMETTKSLVGKR